MATRSTEELATQDTPGYKHASSRIERLQQLERIVSSSHFRNSKRYPSFLRFVVERTVEENSEVLKERNLGVEVFGRSPNYDTNADPIVRVTAGEVRKRIALYYQTAGHEDELRIDLPLGSYVPHFHPAHNFLGTEGQAENATPVSAEEHLVPYGGEVEVPSADSPALEPLLPPTANWFVRRRLALGIAVSAVLALLVGTVAVLARGTVQDAGARYFWQTYTPKNGEPLIVMGVHSSNTLGKAVSTDSHVAVERSGSQSALSMMENSDMVPLSDIISYSKVTTLLTQRSLRYETRSSADTTLEELRTRPVILIGGFNNVWTMRLTSTLRYRLVPQGTNINAIEDSNNPSVAWLFNNLQPAVSNSEDYAIVASYYDTTIEQHVVIAAGIGMNGTKAAAEFLTTEKYLGSWIAENHLPPNKNIELVLSTAVLDGQPGPPHVIASAVW